MSLFALVMISALIVTFIFMGTLNREISFSSAGQARAGIIAVSALNFIKGDCVAEIQNGSIQQPDPTASGIPIYMPATNVAMAPYRMTAAFTNAAGRITNTAIPANMVKWSSGTYPLWSNAAYYFNPGPIRAYPGNSTANLSVNGHYINTNRWAKPVFNTNNFPTAVVPEWVLMTRQGPYTNAGSALSQLSVLANPSQTNANYVVGRYAYVVYDEGGLLDVAAAGYSPTTFASDPTDVGRKGSQGFADLGTNGLGLTQAQADQLVNWRNVTTGVSTNYYVGYLTTNASTSGFLQAAPRDQGFVSRQDLIQYWTGTSANELGASSNLLQYVTTFSREKNAPSWGPEHDANDTNSPTFWNGSNTDTPYDLPLPGATNLITENDPAPLDYAYHTDANLTTSYNRFFPNVRVKTAFTRLSGEQAMVGESLMKNRFDLAKLAWITTAALPGISPGNASDVYTYFGLTRNPDGWSWTYNHSYPNSTPPTSASVVQTSSIMTLDQVANANREPDFFELLQAGILRGGLGLCSGSASNATNTASSQNGGEFYRVYMGQISSQPVSAFDDGGVLFHTDAGNYVVNAQSMYQIIQIGANVIDQYSSDNFPTEIVLNNQHFYGIKNLPYFNGLGTAALRISPTAAGSLQSANSPDITGNAANQAYVHQWFTFALWNPHQNAANPPASGPTVFRICAWHGQLYPSLSVTGLGIPPTNYAFGITPPNPPYLGRSFEPAVPGATVTTGTPIAGYTDGPAWIGFTNTTAYYPNHFVEPTAISYTNSFTSDGVSGANANDPDGRIATPLGWQRAGIYLGWSWSPDNPYKVPLCSSIYTNYTAQSFKTPKITPQGAGYSLNAPPTFYLQYEDVNTPGIWHTYQELHNMISIYGSASATGDAFMEPNDPAWASWSVYPTYNNGVLNGGPIPPANTNNYPLTNVTGYCSVGNNPGPLVANADTFAVFSFDPRTVRYNIWGAHQPTAAPHLPCINTNNWYTVGDVLKGGAHGPHFDSGAGGQVGGGGQFAPAWTDNTVTATNNALARGWDLQDNGLCSYYTDRDSVRRTADAAGWTNASPLPSGALTQRPFFLARPFRSVADIGYAFRDDPWKSLNLISYNSADSGLLDLFTLSSSTTNAPPPDVVAGKLNINSAAANSIAAGGTTNVTSPVLQALISQALRDYQPNSPTTLNTAITNAGAVNNIQKLASNVVTYINTNTLINMGDLPGAFPQFPTNAVPVPLYTGLKEPSEAFVRAVVDGSGTRTWNLMIDVIAQSGKYSPAARNLDNFTVEGEKHYWLHVAIDRFTGQVVDQQLEPVRE